MSRTYETLATLTVAGDETDLTIRAHVSVEPGLGMGGGWGAEVDGSIMALVAGRWVPLDDLELDAGDQERASEALCDVALEDDGGLDADEYGVAS